MSGRDFGRGDRDGSRDRDRGGDRRGGFGDRNDQRGGYRDRDNRGFGGPPTGARPWERRETGQADRPAGNRPFDRADRPEADREVRVERYYEEPRRPPRPERGDRFPRGGEREERGGDRGDRFRGDRERGGDIRRDAAPGPSRAAPRVEQRGEPSSEIEARRQRWDVAAPENQSLAASPFVAPPAGEAGWTYHHLTDSWRDEERLRGWMPSDDDLREMVEDNIEADPNLNARDRRNIRVEARDGTVTLTGTVRSRMAKFAAGSDAYWTYGARDVRNELAVRVRGPQAQESTSPAATTTTASSAPRKGAGEPSGAANETSARGEAAGAEDALVAGEAPAKKPKRASKARTTAAVEPPTVTEADPTGIDDEGYMPPRASSPAPDPHRGKIEPPHTTATDEVRAIDASAVEGDDR